jgi:hypothetical protein
MFANIYSLNGSPDFLALKMYANLANEVVGCEARLVIDDGVGDGAHVERQLDAVLNAIGVVRLSRRPTHRAEQLVRGAPLEHFEGTAALAAGSPKPARRVVQFRCSLKQ